ncbi:MAG TPA: GDSL-type esterase/lipase family protein [Solirubrobacteraceae bacterium]
MTPAAATPAPTECRLGLLAFGDSITNGGGELQWGVALQSWALWTARGLGLPYTGYAVDAARVTDVVERQIPAFERRSARPDARYDVGCVYIGVNDVRGLDWAAAAFAADYEHALRFLRDRCDRVVTLTAPLRLGSPPAGPKVADLNAVVRAAAADAGALVVDLSTFGARNHVMVDRVHPTAFGQIAIAERVLAVLANDGLPTAVAPSSLIDWHETRRGRLRGDLTYLYRDAKQRARAVVERRRRARELCGGRWSGRGRTTRAHVNGRH